jgi:hypothetical protein
VRRALLALAVLAAFAAAGDVRADDPAAQQESLPDGAWATRLSEATLRRDAALMRLARDERTLRTARHRKYPRGEALRTVERNVEQARARLSATEQELPELLEHARRAGVSAAVLGPFEGESALLLAE